VRLDSVGQGFWASFHVQLSVQCTQYACLGCSLVKLVGAADVWHQEYAANMVHNGNVHLHKVLEWKAPVSRVAVQPNISCLKYSR
jgi:hypothetical protein